MILKTVTCFIFMGSALMFGGAAYAETMVGASAVSDVDLPAVQARCDQLATAESPTSLTESTEDSSDDSTAGAADATLDSVEQVDEATSVTTTSIDIDAVTLESCKAAGLIK